MNPDTGAIATFENDKDAKRAGHTVPIQPEDVERLMGMSRPERKEWARDRNPAPHNVPHPSGQNRATRRKMEKAARKADKAKK